MEQLRRFWALWPLRAAVFFLLFTLPWPGLRHGYQASVAAALGVVVGQEEPVELRFSAPPAEEPGFEVRARATELSTGQTVETALDVGRSAYRPAAVLLALALATRLPWRRKLVVVGAGLTLVHALLLLPLFAFFSGKLPLVVFDLAPATRVFVDVLYRSLVAPLGMAYVVPAFVCLVLVWLLTPRAPAAGSATPAATGSATGSATRSRRKVAPRARKTRRSAAAR